MMEVSSVNNNINKELFSNIEISNKAKKEIYENCLKGKRAGDIRFRYAGLLTAMIGALAIGYTGIGTYAYYQSVQTRMESMPQAEVEEYRQDLIHDTAVVIDDSYSRKLTDEENLRIAELERKYNSEGRYPEENIERVETLAEWDGKSVCYVEEDNKLHIPEEMTDEDILSFIDYSTKKDYVMEQEAEKEADDTPSPYVAVENVSEADLVRAGYDALSTLFGKDVAKGWNTRVEAFKPSVADPSEGTGHDMYFVYYDQVGGSSYSTDYVAVFNMNDLSLIGVAVRGKEHWAALKSYADADAAAKVKEDLPKVTAEIERLYGFKDYDLERDEVVYDYSDLGENDARQARYVFRFGNTDVDVLWDLGSEKLASVEFFPAEGDFYPDFELE